ncbi:MAG TPA: DUF6348 family protein [Candidatus Obscuribacterales bacterium]
MYETNELSALSDFARQALVMAMRSQDLSPREEPDCISLESPRLKARCVFLGCQDDPQRSRVDLGVELLAGSSSPCVLRTRTIGIGRSLEEAVLRAVQIIVEGGVPPVLAALGRPGAQALASGFVTEPQWQRRAFWEAFGGPVQTATRHRDLLSDYLSASPLIRLLGSPAGFAAAPLTWLNIGIEMTANQRVSTECLLNGTTWEEGAAALIKFSCPTLPGPFFFRQFFCIRAKPL